jgi:hypothetical protein
MLILAMHFKQHSTYRLEEVGFLLAAIAGAAFFAGGLTPMGRRGGQVFGGLALAVGAIILIVAVHWGTRP